MRKKMLKQFDKDGDGKLSESEREAAKAAMQKRGAEFFSKMDKLYIASWLICALGYDDSSFSIFSEFCQDSGVISVLKINTNSQPCNSLKC